MKLNNFSDVNKWIFRALLHYNRTCPSSDKISGEDFRKVSRYFNTLLLNSHSTYNRKAL